MRDADGEDVGFVGGVGEVMREDVAGVLGEDENFFSAAKGGGDEEFVVEAVGTGAGLGMSPNVEVVDEEPGGTGGKKGGDVGGAEEDGVASCEEGWWQEELFCHDAEHAGEAGGGSNGAGEKLRGVFAQGAVDFGGNGGDAGGGVVDGEGVVDERGHDS